MSFAQKINIPTTIISVILAAASGATSVWLSKSNTETAISEALENDLAEAMVKAQQKVQAAKLAAEVPGNLKPWALAQEDMPEGRYIYGSLNAEFSLVEFSDLECPFCQRLHETPKTLVEQSGGKINWEWQNYPLAFHNPIATQAAEAAECVGEISGNKAFWAFTGSWFAKTQLNGQGPEDIANVAASVGTPRKEFTECLESGRYKDLIKKQTEKGTALGVTGTPATFVIDNSTGNRLLVKGAQSPQAFMQALKQLVEMRTEKPNQKEASDAEQ